MKHPILLNLKKQYPSLKKREKAPANSMYLVSFAKKTWWKNDDISIIQQDYDAKDAYLSLIEINTKIPLQLTISCIQADLYWFYQLSGTTHFFIPNNNRAGVFSVNSQEYTLMYASQRNYEVHIDTGSHLLFFFVVKADWLFRKAEKDLVHFEYLIEKLRQRTIACVCTRKLAIHHRIHKEFLQLIKTRLLGALEMDVAIYGPISRLVSISHQDWSNKNLKKQSSLALIQSVRGFIKAQIKRGELPALSKIATTFKLSHQHLARIHKEHYAYTLQRFIIVTRLEEGWYLIKEKGYTPTEAANQLGYSNPSSFSAQFKQYYNISPREVNKQEPDI